MLGLLVELLQRVGVGGVAGLGALGLGHVELVEQHDLELLGRAEVDLLADHGVRVVGGLPDLGGEVALELLEMVDVDGDADLLHVREHVDQRQLDLGQQAGAAGGLHLAVERLGEVDDRPRVQHRRRGDVVAAADRLVEEHVLVGLALGAQLAPEVAQGEVGQVVGALVGLDEVGRERGVADQARERPAVRGQREHRPLGVVEHLRAGRVGEPGRERRVVLGRQAGDVDVRREPAGVGDGDPVDRAGARAPGAADVHADVLLAEAGQQVGDLAGTEPAPGQLEAALVDRSSSGPSVSMMRVAELTAELEVVEERERGVAVPRLAARGRPARARGRGRTPAR